MDRFDLLTQTYLDQKSPVWITLIEQDGESFWVARVQENGDVILFESPDQVDVLQFCKQHELPSEIL